MKEPIKFNFEKATAAEVRAAVVAVITPFATELAGVGDGLPEGMKKVFTDAYASLNEFLAQLAPTEQVPAAQQAGWALESLAAALQRLTMVTGQVMGGVAKLRGEYAGMQTQFAGLDGKLKAGELIEKPTAQRLVDAAVTAARDEERAALLPEVKATRQTAVELAGLPVPAADVLALPAKDWATRFEQARANAGELGGRGVKLGGKGAGLMKDLAWLPKEEFAGRLESWADLLPPKGAGGGGGGGGAVRAGGVDPLLGNPGAGDGAKTLRGVLC